MRRAVVTGASSGIGAAFARRYAADGHAVTLVARRADALDRVAAEIRAAGGTAEALVADLATEAGLAALAAAARDADALVLNAGVTLAAAVGTTDADTRDRLARLLATGVARTCEAVVPHMVARGGGDVVVVSSIAAFAPMRKSALYAAAKAYAAAYARSLALEVGPRGVRVCVVCPGYVRTAIHEEAGLGHLRRRVPSWLWCDPEDVVNAGLRALARGRTLAVPGFPYRMARPWLASGVVQATWRRLARRDVCGEREIVA
jgi:short-subunit dehydrogenase